LDTYHPDIQYLLEERSEELWLFFVAKRGPPAKQVWETMTGLKDKGDDHFIMWNGEDFLGAFTYSRKAPTKFVMCLWIRLPLNVFQ
jgi:hypothetical protein